MHVFSLLLSVDQSAAAYTDGHDHTTRYHVLFPPAAIKGPFSILLALFTAANSSTIVLPALVNHNATDHCDDVVMMHTYTHHPDMKWLHAVWGHAGGMGPEAGVLQQHLLQQVVGWFCSRFIDMMFALTVREGPHTSVVAT